MYNADTFRQQQGFDKSFSEMSQFQNKDWKFPRIRPTDLEDGQYQLRFCPPNMQRCPNGWVKVSTHRIQIERGNDKNTIECLGPDCVDDPKDASFYIMELLQCIQDLKVYDGMSDELKSVIGSLVPWARYWFPCIIWGVEIKVKEKGKNNKDWTKHTYRMARPGEEAKPYGVVLELWQKKLLDRFDQIISAIPHLNHHEMGYTCTFSKSGTTYGLDPQPLATKLSVEVLKLMGDQDYPRLLAMRKKLYKPHAEIVKTCQTAWWAPFIEQLGPEGIDLSDERVDGLPFDT